MITSVSVAPASVQDGPQAPKLIGSQPKSRRPRRVLGDTAYGNGKARNELAKREVGVLAPVPTGPPTRRLAKAEFEVDLEAEAVTCPAGKTDPLSPPDRKGHFRTTDCRPCPLRARCTTKERCSVTLSAHEDLLQAARLALEDEATAEHLIERDRGWSACSACSHIATERASPAT